MDTASFSIGVISLAFQVFNAASDGLSSLRKTKDPQNPLSQMVDLEVQQCRFISWAKATGLSGERVLQFDDPFMQQTVLSVLCNMLRLLENTVNYSNEYGLVFQDPGTPGIDPVRPLQLARDSQAAAAKSLDSAMIILTNKDVEKLVLSARASFSVFQRLHWKISDGRLFQNLIQRFREMNDNLESLLPRPIQVSTTEMSEATMLQSEDVKYLKCLAQVASKSWISLAQSANFKSSYIDSDTNKDATNHAKFIPRARLALDNPNEESRTLATYELDELYPARVFVEWKRTGVMKTAMSIEESERITLDRIKRLAVILEYPTDASFRSLVCLGYTTSTSGRIGLVFKIPDGAAKANPSVTLHDLLRNPDQTRSTGISSASGNGKPRKPSLEDRMRLGHALALSLYRVHRTGVIHKHITHTNIVFFRSKSTSTISILEPFLTGFDFAREESMVNQSETPNDMRDVETLYRHPLCELGKTSTKRVDIYALGILLIEIACWDPIESAQKQAKKRSVTDFHEFLLSEFVESGFLAYRMGTCYQNAVRCCLQDSFENEEQESSHMLGLFYGNVVQNLTAFLSQ